MENDLLRGRTAIVTGAGGGVGRGIALAMAAAGANVVVAARRAETGEPTVTEITSSGGVARLIVTDVTDRTAISACVGETVSAFGGLDCFVHNALSGNGGLVPLQDLEDEAVRGLMATAVRASFDCAQITFPHLAARSGSLILLTSAAGVEGSAYLPVYGMAKAAQRGFAKSLAREWGPHGVRVNSIGPVALTPALASAYQANPVLEQRLVERTPLGRIGDPTADIGPVAVFLASDLARYVTGQTIMVDGGGFLGL